LLVFQDQLDVLWYLSVARLEVPELLARIGVTMLGEQLQARMLPAVAPEVQDDAEERKGSHS
jgi:hypothetical protein